MKVILFAVALFFDGDVKGISGQFQTLEECEVQASLLSNELSNTPNVLDFEVQCIRLGGA